MMNNTSVVQERNYPHIFRMMPLFILSLLAASYLLAFFPVWTYLIQFWLQNDDYSHGFLIVPISVFILWQKRNKLRRIPSDSSHWGLLLVVLSLLMYYVGQIGEIATLSSFSMIAALIGACLFLRGFLFFKEAAFPLIFLFFMIPVPSQIYSTSTIPLQLIVSKLSTIISMMIGVPILREGNVLFIPGRVLEVVQACSGMRSLMSLFMLSAVIGYFTLSSNILRLILLFLSLPVAIIVNIFRVSVMVIAFHFFNYDLSTGMAHTILGILIFILALVFVMALKSILSVLEKRWT